MNPISPFDVEAQAQAIREQAARMEQAENAHIEQRYQGDWGRWYFGAPVRAALGLPVQPEPEPPLRFHADFDRASWSIVAVSGPDRFERIMPPAKPKPIASDSLPGEPWANYPDTRHIRPNDPSEPPYSVEFEGAKWERVNRLSPFGSVTKTWQRVK